MKGLNKGGNIQFLIMVGGMIVAFDIVLSAYRFDNRNRMFCPLCYSYMPYRVDPHHSSLLKKFIKNLKL